MDVGEIYNFCIKHHISNYTINSDGFIDVIGSVILGTEDGIEDGHLPDGIRFGYVSESFNCTWASLTSLNGCPLVLGGIFCCYYGFMDWTDENFDVLYRYNYSQLRINSNFKLGYDRYCKIRKRRDIINELLR